MQLTKIQQKKLTRALAALIKITDKHPDHYQEFTLTCNNPECREPHHVVTISKILKSEALH